MNETVKDIFKDDFFVLSAMRYALGKMTYIVSQTTCWIIDIWPCLTSGTKSLIKREVEDALMRDTIDRDNGKDYCFLGSQCDRDSWEVLDEFIDRQCDEP